MIDFGLEVPNHMDCADMGLGKTAATLSLIDTLVYDMMVRRKVLVVGPKRVAYRSWPNEIRKWSNFRHMRWRCIDAADFGLTPSIVEPAVMDEDGTIWVPGKKGANRIADKKPVKLALRALKEEIHFISYDFFPWLVKLLGNNWPYDVVVLDESTFVKNADTVRWRSARSIRKAVKNFIALTGTPSPKGITDLWAPVYLLDGGKRLGKTLGVFREAYCSPVLGKDGTVFGWAARNEQCKAEVRAKLAQIAISLKSEDYLQLPQRIDNFISIELPEKARRVYDDMETQFFHDLGSGGALVAQNSGIKVGKLVQIANGAVYDDLKAPRAIHDAKLDALEELMESTSGNILVGIGYKPDRDRILKRIKGARAIGERGVLDAWERGEVKMMVAHPSEGAHGLNIQEGGDMVVWYGQQFSLELYLQFNKRLHRNGQLSDRVVVNHLVARNTIDEDIVAGLQARHDEQELLLSAIKARAVRRKA